MRGNGGGVGWLEQGVRLCEGARNGHKDTDLIPIIWIQRLLLNRRRQSGWNECVFAILEGCSCACELPVLGLCQTTK